MLNSIVFFCVALDQQYKLSNYIKMPTSIMFGDEVGEKLWATLDNSFRSFFRSIEKYMLQVTRQRHHNLLVLNNKHQRPKF